MEEEKVIISLNEMGVSENEPLEKVVEDCRNKTFRKVLNYMLDPRGDNLNHAYDHEQESLMQVLKMWKEKHEDEKNPSSIDILYKNQNDEYSDPVGWDDHIKEYNDIVRTKTLTKEFGGLETYEGIDLEVRFNPGGSIKSI